MVTDTPSAVPHTAGAPLPEWLTSGIRYLGVTSGLLAIVFVINNFLIFGFGLPGPWNIMTGSERSALGFAQCALVLAAILYPAWKARSGGSLRIDSTQLNSIAEYLIRLAFWSVFFSVLSFWICKRNLIRNTYRTYKYYESLQNIFKMISRYNSLFQNLFKLF